jgi:hypothetical protein
MLAESPLTQSKHINFIIALSLLLFKSTGFLFCLVWDVSLYIPREQVTPNGKDGRKIVEIRANLPNTTYPHRSAKWRLSLLNSISGSDVVASIAKE